MNNDLILDPRLAGISGDMILSALADLSGENGRKIFNHFAKKILRMFNLQKNVFDIREVTVNEFAGCQVYQEFYEDLEERNFDAIRGYFQQVYDLDILSSRAVSFCKGTLELLISVEARVHGKSLTDETAHFHELGSVDSVIDICGVAFMIDHLDRWNDRIITLPLNTGSGQVILEHGTLTVPAPAVVDVLSLYKMPFFSDGTLAELITPTGVAILANLVSKSETTFPLFRANSSGVGHGRRKGNKPNFLRIYSGELLDSLPLTTELEEDQVTVIETNVDDVTGEILGAVFEPLFEKGALDVTAFPLLAKKNRPGWCLRVIAKPKNTESLANVLFKNLRTLGVRFYVTKRLVLQRQTKLVKVRVKGKEYETRIKLARRDDKLLFSKIEFEDLKKIAKIHDLSVQEVNEIITNQILESREIDGVEKNGD
ncbi:MAG: nickel pincer cofactor biosynthesis protein LarC [Candidatus Hodarchaeales archaeon]|jgi:uncharacterized protein (TIGR00299 family) protein